MDKLTTRQLQQDIDALAKKYRAKGLVLTIATEGCITPACFGDSTEIAACVMHTQIAFMNNVNEELKRQLKKTRKPKKRSTK